MKKSSSRRSAENPQFKTQFSFVAFLEFQSCLWSLIRRRLIAGMVCSLVFCTALKAESIIKFKEINACLVVIPVSIDGKGPFDFIVDTGSDDTTIDPGLVKELDVKPTSTVMLVTAAGLQEVPSGYPLRNVQLGSRMVPEVKSLAMNLAALKPYRIRGIVGQNLLSQFNYCIDYRRHEIAIEENGELDDRLVDNARALSFQKREGRWMVHVEREAGMSLKMVLDTGANDLLFYDGDRLSLDIERGSFHTVQVVTNLGIRELRAARLRHFKVGGIVLRNQNVVLARKGTGDETHPEDGLLPARLFGCVYFNNTRMQVVLNPLFSRTMQIAGE